MKQNTLKKYKGLSSVVIVPEGITEISSNFEGPMTIDTLVLPKSLIRIETRAFYSIKINTLKVHDSIERIDEFAFYSYIENIEIKNTYGNALYVLQKLKHFCRNSLTKLKTIRITEKTLSEKELIEIKKLFTENKNIKIINDQCVTNDENKRIKGLSRIKIEDELNIESTVEEIGSNAFSGGIFNLTLPENVKILSINAFEYNYIGILTIYDSLEKIGVNAFGINLNEIRIINRGKAVNVLKEIKRTHYLLQHLRKIQIIGEPLNLIELITLKKLFPKIKISVSSLEQNTMQLPEPTKKEEVSQENIKDEEALEILNKIRKLIKNCPENDKSKIESKINKTIQEYKESLEKVKNSFSLDSSLELETTSPKMIRENFITKLETMYGEIYHSIYNKLLIEINDYINWIETEQKIKEPKIINNVEDKIKFIIHNALNYEKEYLSELKTVLENTKTELSKILMLELTKTPILLLEEPDRKFEKEISEIYKKVSRRKEIEETLNGKNETSLGIDIKEIKNRISEFNKSDKEECTKELTNTIQKYYKRLLENSELTIGNIELEIRKELLPFIYKIMIIKPKPNLNKIKEKIDEALKVIEQKEENTNDIIIDAITKIKNLNNNENLQEEEQKQIKEKLKEIFIKWKNKIEKEQERCLEYLQEEDIIMASAKTLMNKQITIPKRILLEDQNIQIAIQILGELEKLQTQIEEKINSRIECMKLLKSL